MSHLHQVCRLSDLRLPMKYIQSAMYGAQGFMDPPGGFVIAPAPAMGGTRSGESCFFGLKSERNLEQSWS